MSDTPLPKSEELTDSQKLEAVLGAVRTLLGLQEWDIYMKTDTFPESRYEHTAVVWFLEVEPHNLSAMVRIPDNIPLERAKYAICCALAEMCLHPLVSFVGPMLGTEMLETHTNNIKRQTAIRIGRGLYTLFRGTQNG